MIKVEWPTTNEINLVEAFILADRIHMWIYENQHQLDMNYLTLICLHGADDSDEEKWAASFDCLGDDGEWAEHIEDFPFAAAACCPEEAIYRAAMKVKERIN